MPNTNLMLMLERFLLGFSLLVLVASGCKQEDVFEFDPLNFAPTYNLDDTAVYAVITDGTENSNWKARASYEDGYIRIKFTSYDSFPAKLNVLINPFDLTAKSYTYDAIDINSIQVSYTDSGQEFISNDQVSGSLVVDSVSNYVVYGHFDFELENKLNTGVKRSLECKSFRVPYNFVTAKVGTQSKLANYVTGDLSGGPRSSPIPFVTGWFGTLTINPTLWSDKLDFRVLFIPGKTSYTDTSILDYFDKSKRRFNAKKVNIKVDKYYYDDLLEGTFDATMVSETDSSQILEITNGRYRLGSIN